MSIYTNSFGRRCTESRLTTKFSGPGHGPVSYDRTESAARGRGQLQREVRRLATPGPRRD